MTILDPQLTAAITAAGIRRVTHFTNSRNLPRILGSGQIMSTGLMLSEKVTFEATDAQRYDRHLDHICCNLEYPNMYYFDRAADRPNTVNYSDWVILFLDPLVAAQPGTLFAPGNAAKSSGATLAEGADALEKLYAPRVYEWSRSTSHWPASPTDVQAEVLIPGPIRVSEVRGIVVPDGQSLQREVGRLEQIGHDPHQFSWYVSAELFTKNSVVAAIRRSADIQIDGPWDTRQEGGS